MLDMKKINTSFSQIILFVVPLMLTGILQLLYNAADSMVVGRFDGADSLAAVSSVSSLVNLLVNFFMGMSAGAAVAVAHDYGAGDYNGVSKTVHTSVSVSVILGIIVGAFGICFSEVFLVWMGSPENILPLSSIYLKIFFIGTPANMLFNYCAAIIRSTGDTKRPLIILASTGLVNVVLNLIFVVGLKIGVAGVALATIISQYISAIAVIVFLLKTDSCIRFKLSSLAVDFGKLKRIIIVGFPAGLQSALFSISNVIIQSSVNSFGSVVMAGSGASHNIEGFTFTAMNSVHHAALTFVGQSVGAKEFENIHKVTAKCVLLVSVLGIIMGGASYLFSKELLLLFLPKSPEAIPYGQLRLLYVAVPYFTCGMMDVLVGAQRGLGMSFIPMINSLIGSCAFRVLWIMTVFTHYRTLEAIFISYTISWVLTTIAHLIFYLIGYNRIIKHQKRCVN